MNSENQLMIEPFGYVKKDKNQFISKLNEGLIQFEINSKKIRSDTLTITLEYYGLMCDCPQWITTENKEIYEKSIESGNTISEDSLFIRLEPENSETINPFDLTSDDTENYIFEFKGQFYNGKHKWISEDNIG